MRSSQGASSLVDRNAERSYLDRLIEAARSGTSSALVVRGEAGVGKSALLDDVVARAADCQVVRAAGVESEMELPFASLHQLCAPFLEELERLPTPQRNALATAFGLQPGPPPDRFLVGLAVLTLLSDVAERQPLLCLVDDAQWLDRASGPILGFVARRLAAESVVMVFAVREPWESTDFAGLPELAIGPLSDPDARRLLALAIPGRLDETVRTRILAEARGNPLALLELPRAWTPAAFAGGFGLPDSGSVSLRIEESFRRRLTPLPDDSRSLLLVAAAEPTGDPVLLWTAAGHLGIPAESARAATSTGLIEIGPQVRFRHPLVRSVVYVDATPDLRRRTHRALADATDAQLDPDRRAWHRAASVAGPDEAVALELEHSAGRAQARGGVAAAAAFLQRSVEMTQDPARRADRALVAAQASLEAGAADATQRLLETAAAAATDEFQRVRVALLRAHLATAAFDVDGPAQLLRVAKRLEAFDPQLARQTYLIGWGAAIVAGQEEVGLEICRTVQALPPSESPGALDIVLQAMTRLTLDGPAVAIPQLQAAARAAVDLPVDAVIGWGWAAIGASNAVWDKELERETLERYVSLLRDAGALAHLPILLSALGVAIAASGDLEGAAAVMAQGQAVSAATGTPPAPYTALRIAALRGREDEAAPMIASLSQGGVSAGQGLATRQARGAAALLFNGLARYDQAAIAAREAVGSRLDHPSAMLGLPELVEAAARSGDTETAAAAAARLGEMTRGCGTDYPLGMDARSQALVVNDGGTEDRYREAIDRLGRTTMRPDLARAHLLFGEWLRREGRRIDAREQLRAAHELFTAIGMEAFAERARGELLATGERVRKRSVETRDDLTPQELQIARLAADGRTNPEIGAQLFLSRRTVEWHLRKVFTKLDIESRRELPAAVQRMAPRR